MFSRWYISSLLIEATHALWLDGDTERAARLFDRIAFIVKEKASEDTRSQTGHDDSA